MPRWMPGTKVSHAGKPVLALSPVELLETLICQRYRCSVTSSIGWHSYLTRFHQVTVLTLELDSPTLPPGKKLIFQLADTAKLADTRKNPIIIKEGVEYKCVSSFFAVVIYLTYHQCAHHIQSEPLDHLGMIPVYSDFASGHAYGSY